MIYRRREGDLIRDGLNICPEARCATLQAFGWRLYVRWGRNWAFQFYRSGLMG